jgi:hypothetical protein
MLTSICYDRAHLDKIPLSFPLHLLEMETFISYPYIIIWHFLVSHDPCFVHNLRDSRVGTYVKLQWLVKTHHIQICDLVIEASDIKATSMVLNQFEVRKLNSEVDRIPWFCSRIDQSTSIHCSA